MIPVIIVLLLLAGCADNKKSDRIESDTVIQSGTAAVVQTDESESTEKTYRQISQEEAKNMMQADDGHVIVDVRRQDEYDDGHIPGAICIPNESIGNTQPEELPDRDQVILVYCRSGRRSKQAAQKLFRPSVRAGGRSCFSGDHIQPYLLSVRFSR